MAHGILQSFDSEIAVYSAGTEPADKVNPLAVRVMNEIGIDISSHYPKSVEEYIQQSWTMSSPCAEEQKKHRIMKGMTINL